MIIQFIAEGDWIMGASSNVNLQSKHSAVTILSFNDSSFTDHVHLL